MSKDTSLIDSFPFASYLDSNYIPSDEEVVQIKSFLTQPREQLEQMKAEMDRLQAELSSVKSKYDSLYRQFNSCASLITLPRRVPDDVLEEIFCQSLPTDRNALLDIKAAPLIFTRICPHWRQIALASPRLWSTIHIHALPKSYNSFHPDELPPKQDELRAAAALEWLKRSGDLPLQISLIAYSDPFGDLLVFDPYLSLLVPFCSRWKSLILEGDSRSFSRILGAANLRSLELLVLDFDPSGYHEDNRPEDFISSLSNCGLLTVPSLRRLSIRRLLTMDPTNLNANWSQLTHLELGAPSGKWRNLMTMHMSTASEILRVSSRLVSCRIKIGAWGGSSSPIHLMRLPFLRQLSIDIEGYILPFTENLEVPALQEIKLRVINITGNNVDYKTCLAPLFRPPQGTIQKLIIDTRYLDHESFLDILRKCPDLISLTVNDSQLYTSLSRDSETPLTTIDDQFLERISSKNGEVLCSQLEEFICDYPAPFSTTGMIEFIKRKQDGNIPKLAKLKEVAMLPRSEEDLRGRTLFLPGELQPYISRGLTFHVGLRAHKDSNASFRHLAVYGHSTQYADFWVL